MDPASILPSGTKGPTRGGSTGALKTMRSLAGCTLQWPYPPTRMVRHHGLVAHNRMVRHAHWDPPRCIRASLICVCLGEGGGESSRGIKVACEAPRGLRASLISTLHEVGPEEWSNAGPDPAEEPAGRWARLHCALALLHATVKERGKFGALGWNQVLFIWGSRLESGLRV